MAEGLPDLRSRLIIDTSDLSNVHTRVQASFKGLAGIAAGALAGFSIGKLFGDSIAEATEAQKVMGQTAAVIKSTGGAAGVTAQQMATLATSLSNVSGVDDEIIQQGENVLATFTSIQNKAGAGNDIFNQATTAALDLSKALGQDLQSSVIQIGKARNDPIAGMTALKRVGVSFTEQQKAQILALQQSGDLLGAQKLILAELNKEFGGTAAAVATPMEKLKVAVKNVEESVGGALMPALSALAPVFSNLLTALEPVLTALGGAFAQVLQLLAPIITTLAPPVAQLVGLLGQLLVPVAGLLAGFAPIAALILQLANVALTALMPAFQALIGPLNAVVRMIAEALQPVIAALIPIIQLNAGVYVELVKAFLPLIPALGQLIVALLPILPPLIELATLQLRLIGLMAPLIALVAQFAAVLISGLATAITTVVNFLRNDLFNWFQRLPAAIDNILTSIGNFAEGVGRFFSELPGKILTAIGDLGRLLFQAGRDLIEGLIRGIKSHAGDIVGAVTDPLGTAVKAGKSLLGIGSPSKVFMGIGQDTMEGFALGVEGMDRRISDAVSNTLGIGPLGNFDVSSMRGVASGAPSSLAAASLESATFTGSTTVHVDVDGRTVATAEAPHSFAAQRSFRRSRQ